MQISNFWYTFKKKAEKKERQETVDFKLTTHQLNSLQYPDQNLKHSLHRSPNKIRKMKI